LLSNKSFGGIPKSSDPENDYDSLIQSMGKSMYITDINKNKIKLIKRMYVNLIKSYGKFRSFEPLTNTKLIYTAYS